MKILFTIVSALLCLQATAQNSWTPIANFNNSRLFSIAFSIGNSGYVGLGKQLVNNVFFNDLWAYETTTNSWTAKASFPGAARSQANVFVLNGKAYVIGGENASGFEFNDVWEYNPATDIWLQKGNFPGGGRRAGFSFSIGNFGYLGSGISSTGTMSDCWEYDPVTDTWTSKAAFPSGLGHSAYASFAIGQKGYVVGGLMFNSSAVTLNETWEFDPAADTWIQKSNYPHPVGQATAFVLNGKGFVTGGNSTSPVTYFNDLNEYDPVTDVWTSKAIFPGSPRSGLSAFAVGNIGYTGIGYSANQVMYNDWYQYIPDSTISTINELSINNYDIAVYPNPVSDFLYLNDYHGAVEIINIHGQTVMNVETNGNNSRIDLSTIGNGMYYIRFYKNQIRPVKFIKQ